MPSLPLRPPTSTFLEGNRNGTRSLLSLPSPPFPRTKTLDGTPTRSAMEEYPEELRTPPVALVALVGCPDVHQTVSTFLHSEQPPINTLALPDFSKISVIAKKRQRDGAMPDAVAAAGILKRDWLSKHRTRVPAVVAVMFSAGSVSGDPAQWQQVCTDLDSVKAVIRGRNIKLVVVLVQTSMRADINEDILTTLRKRAEIDGKYLLVYSQKDSSDHRQSLSRLVGAFAELSNIYYRDEARKIKSRIEKKNISSFELNIRYCFKVAIYGEFRRDWVEALRFYEDGYHALHEMVKVSTRLPPIQRLIEIKAVAEQFQFKVSTLLLHGGKVAEAITWFRKHIATYEQHVGVSEVAFLHWDWMSRQFLVFAELLETSSATIPTNGSPRFGMLDNPLTEWEFHPAYYYQLAANYLREKKNCLSQSLSACGFSELADIMDASPDSVIPSVFVGQSVRLLEQGTELSMLPLNDAEYTCYALAEGKRFQDVSEIIALLRRSMESFSSLKASRMASYCTGIIAREYFSSKEFSSAKQLFSEVAELYRQEGWVTLLWESLGYLRECSRELGLLKDYIEFSLEMAAMPVLSTSDVASPSDNLEYGPGGAPSFSRRQMIQDEVIKLLEKESSFINDGDCSALSLEEDQVIHIEIDPVSPLRTVLLASVAFHDQSVKPGSPTLLTVALLSQLPIPLEVVQLEIQFNQADCNVIISGAQKKDSMVLVEEKGPREEIVPNLTLEMNSWLRLTHTIKSGISGKLECLSVNAKLGSHFTICCKAESPASMEGLPLWKFEDQVKTFPTNDLDLSFAGQKIIQIEEPEPQVDLVLNASGPALVGEIFTIPVFVNSKGHPVHSGELKINIVDARSGGLMSPREIEASSDDTRHVELLSVSGMEDEDDSQKDVDNIKKITQSFGVVPIPVIGVGESWAGKLEIKWHRPKHVMLYVSLGYSPNSQEAESQKVNVHMSLQIEGKIPLIVNHQFMLPFRREPLLLSKIKPETESDKLVSLVSNETNILVVSARNCCEIPLCLDSITIKADGEESVCFVNHVGSNLFENALLMPGEEFKQIFSVFPRIDTPKLGVGSVCVKWRRNSNIKKEPEHCIMMEQKLPCVHAERPPLIVSLDCPPHAVLGIPFMVYVRVQNLTSFLQEIKYNLDDSQSFLFSGSHKTSAFILPKTEHVISYKLVPLSSGHHQLPRFTISSIRYSAGFQTSVSASTIFIFPSEPHFNYE